MATTQNNSHFINLNSNKEVKKKRKQETGKPSILCIFNLVRLIFYREFFYPNNFELPKYPHQKPLIFLLFPCNPLHDFQDGQPHCSVE